MMESYDEGLRTSKTALYEKTAPVLYWKPNLQGQGQSQIVTEVAGRKRSAVETKSTFDFGSDVVVCNVMTDSKEVV